MSDRRARRAVSDTAESVIRLAANAANWAPRSKILLLGAFAALSVIVAVPILFQADMPPAAADSTLKCYDSAGNYAPCLTRASAAPARFNSRTTWATRPPTWATTALYTTPALYQDFKLGNTSSRSTRKFAKRTGGAAQQQVWKTPGIGRLRATFDTMCLLHLAERAHAYCICCCYDRAGSTRQGTPLADARLWRSVESTAGSKASPTRKIFCVSYKQRPQTTHTAPGVPNSVTASASHTLPTALSNCSACFHDCLAEARSGSIHPDVTVLCTK